jgi:periplasmic divalent cation tolerance protein
VSASFLLVVTTVGSRDEANRMARALVEQRLAACAQISAIDSYYVWEDAVRTMPSSGPVQGRGKRLREAERAIRALHSYDLPAIHAIRSSGRTRRMPTG